MPPDGMPCQKVGSMSTVRADRGNSCRLRTIAIVKLKLSITQAVTCRLLFDEIVMDDQVVTCRLLFDERVMDDLEM